jgi:uncharacterized protein YbjT (DUF2867 family)
MKNALVAGATGLVGSALVKRLLEAPQYDQVHILVRKKIDLSHPKLVQHVVDFDHLDELLLSVKIEDAFCSIGTTIAKAGNRETYYRIDHDYVIYFAEKALSSGAAGFYAVSSMSADPKSAIYYSRMKGEMEQDLKKLNFQRLGIFRPSLLLGPRVEKRAGERFATWMMKLFDFVIPLKYKAIHVDKVAQKMIEVALQEQNGTVILESEKLH